MKEDLSFFQTGNEEFSPQVSQGGPSSRANPEVAQEMKAENGL